MISGYSFLTSLHCQKTCSTFWPLKMSEPKVFTNIKVCLEEKEEQSHYNKYHMAVSFTVRSSRTYAYTLTWVYIQSTVPHARMYTQHKTTQLNTLMCMCTHVANAHTDPHAHCSMQHTDKLHIVFCYCAVVCKIVVIHVLKSINSQLNY